MIDFSLESQLTTYECSLIIFVFWSTVVVLEL